MHVCMTLAFLPSNRNTLWVTNVLFVRMPRLARCTHQGWPGKLPSKHYSGFLNVTQPHVGEYPLN